MRSAFRSRWGPYLVAATILLAILSATTPGGAQDDGDEQVVGVTMSVRGGMDGLYRPGRPVPIDIELVADQLVTGVLEVRSVVGAQTIEHRADIEVPAGSTKRFVVAVPTPASDRAEVMVTLEVDGTTIDRRLVTLDERSNTEFVGVLPLVIAEEDLPPSARLAVDAGTALLQRVSPELLGTGFDGLWLFDSLVATAADLNALSNRETDAVVAWTSAGGHLLIDEIDGPVPRIPSTWQPSPDHASSAGAGLVRLIDGQAKAGNWDDFLLPTAIDDPNSAGELDIRGFSGNFPGSLSNELSRDAGFDLPPITDLLALLAVYALVAGPVSYVILRRRGRAAALWLTVPALAVITTVGVWFIGSELRGNTAAAHATVIVTAEGVDYSTTHVLVDRDVGGIRVPRGWVPTGRLGDAAFGGAPATLDVRPTQTGYDARVQLDVGEFAISTARGTLEADGLAVTASSSENGRIEGEVHNETGVVVHHVTVVSGPAAQDLGTLDPGGRVGFVLTDVDRFDFQPFEWTVWNDAIFDSADMTIGLWNTSSQERGGVNATPLGVVTAVAWTDGLDAPVRTRSGDKIRAGHTLLVTQSSIDIAGDVISNMTVRNHLVRGPADTEIGAGLDVVTGVYQLLTPPGFTGDEMTIHVPRFASDVEIWRDGRWRAVPPGNEERDAVIRGENLSIDGIVHVRAAFERNQIFEFGNGDVLTAYQEPS